jgi:hypothetical protein
MIGRIMPFIFIPISISLPAGVVIYFAVSNLVRVGQQALVTKLEFSGDKADKAEGAGAKPKSKPQVRDAEATPKDTGGKGGKPDVGTPKPAGKSPAGRSTGGRPSGNGAGGARPQPNGARRSGTPAGSGARSRNRKRKRK